MNLWLIPLLPLAGTVVNGFFGRERPNRFVSAVGVGSVALSFLWCVSIFLRHSFSAGPHVETVLPWIVAGNFRADFAFYLDPLSMVMALVVTGVGLLIHIYSVGYMAHEGGYYRYFAYLNLFTFFMLMLVLAGNYLLMFVGWEGVGLCSYLLIGFWFRKKSASDAGKKAFIVNRIGDFGFTLALILMFWKLGSLDFDAVFRAASMWGVETEAGVLTAICLLLLAGATGKSAQIPLYVWLPDAMEGPTPVSALIHAATMVTAGVYMVARSGALYTKAPMALFAVAVVGCLTAIYSASIGLVQTDIKRVLAYSTVSQLGYMFMACGVGAFSAAIFHLMTHAFFKALLFLGAGSVIHALNGEQDMRRMGGLKAHVPATYWTFLFGCLAIAGIFPFAGFFSKDEILWQAYSSPYGHWVFWAVGMVTAAMTAFYVFRLFFLTFYGEPRSEAAEHAHESPPVMTRPLMVLAGLSLVGGWIGWPLAWSGGNRFEHFLAPVFSYMESGQAIEHVTAERVFSLLAVGVGALGIMAAYYFYVVRPEIPPALAERLGALYQVVLNKYYVDEIYQAAVVRPVVATSTSLLWRAMDVGVIDGAANGLAYGARRLGGALRRWQSGNIRSYAGWVLLGAVAVIFTMGVLWAR